MDPTSILIPRVTSSHLAVARGWVNGLDLAELGKRYLAALGDDDGNTDLRVIKSVLSRTLTELANTATRNGLSGGPALHRQAERIRIDARGPSIELRTRISYDEYLAANAEALEEFSDEERFHAYEEAHPLPKDDVAGVKHKRALARQGRLIKRQLQLISSLENLISAPMQWTDRVSGWFSPEIANSLVCAGLTTIQQLAIAICANPTDWYDLAPGIGVSKATRIESYLRSNLGLIEDELAKRGIAYLMVAEVEPDRGRVPVLTLSEITQCAAAPAPSPSLPGVPELDGSRGRLRDTNNPSAIEAANDYEAMKTWLALKQSKATVVLYEREVTRLIAWSIQVRKRPMSSLSVEDAIAYRDFLCAVPAELVIKKGPRRRSSRARDSGMAKDGIPVAGFTKAGLKASTVKKALTIVSGFYSWLMEVRYVVANPFASVRAITGLAGVGQGSTQANDEEGITRARERRSTVHSRVLPHEATEAINRYINSQPAPKDLAFHARVRCIYLLAITTGLRISEIAAARRDHLEYIEPDSSNDVSGGWILHVLGKRDKPREVPVPDFVISEFESYFAHRGLITLPCPSLAVDRGTFLIGGYPRSSKSPLVIGSDSREHGSAAGQFKAAGDGVRPQTIHLALKDLFKIAHASNTFKDERTKEKLEKASTHWLRHTLGTRSVAQGVGVDVVAGVFGHASIATTSIYVQAERHRKMSEMQQLWSKGLG